MSLSPVILSFRSSSSNTKALPGIGTDVVVYYDKFGNSLFMHIRASV